MPKDHKEKATIAYYDRQAEAWTAARGGNEGESYWKAEMEKFHKLLPSGRIIEIGSGPGKDAAALIKMGYEYTGTDASKGLIDVASKGFWAAAVLLHIPKDQIDISLQSIKTIVRNGGFGFISMKAGAGERVDKATERWFAFYSNDGFTQILKRNGFEILDQQTRPEEKDTWLTYFVKKV